MRIYCLYFLLLPLSFNFKGCEPQIDDKLKIKNESDKIIVVVTSTDSMAKTQNMVEYYFENQIESNSEKSILRRGSWDVEILRSYNNKLNVYLYDVDTLKKYQDMKIITKNDLHIKRYSLSKEDLKQTNWRIIFKE